MSDTSSQPALLTGFGLANYRSFDEAGFLLTNIKKVNVLIGKNNSGKSNVLRALHLLSRLDGPKLTQGDGSALTDRHRRQEKDLTAVVAAPLRTLLPPKSEHGGERLERFEAAIGSPVEVWWSLKTGLFLRAPALERLQVEQLTFLLDHAAGLRFNTPQLTPGPFIEKLGPKLAGHAASVVRELLSGMLTVPVFREVRSGRADEQAQGVFDGRNVIHMLRDMQHPVIGEEHKRAVFDKLERFARDLLGVPDLELEVPPRDDRLYVNMHDLRLPLENYGTGIHHLVGQLPRR